MKNNKYGKGFKTQSSNEGHPNTGYVFLVKNPASNEASVCASESIISPGTLVVFETRYGLDLGVVVGDASHIGKEYTPGNCNVCGQGSCDACPENTEEDDQPLVASADMGADGSAIIKSFDSEGKEDSSEEVAIDVSLSPEQEEMVFSDENEEDLNLSTGYEHMAEQPEIIPITPDIMWLERIATHEDLVKYRELSKREDDAMKVCREKILKHQLNMKLVTAHFLLVEPKVVFFFTADVRVDFRDLVKDLVSVFKIRIELRQIGVRDESRVLGGLAVCGRDFCCHGVTDKLSPVSIKMAKEQNLSLNSMKISGPCGRLLCCLSYEQDFYVEEKKKFPPEGSRLKIGHDLMKVVEVNILSCKVTLLGPEGRMMYIDGKKTFYNQESGHWVVDKEYLDELLS